MAFLDGFKRQSQQQPVAEKAQASKPETSKPETYKSVESLPASVKAEAVDAGRPVAKLIEEATRHRHAPEGANDNRSDGKEALMHNQSVPGKSQEALSPTDNAKGHTKDRGRGRSIDL